MTLALFSLYIVGTIAIGLWAAGRSQGTEEDYFLGGRRLSAFAMALSAVSSGRSAWLVIGASASAWQFGLSAVWLFPGYVAAEALMFVTLGPRLRARSMETGALTLPEVLQRSALGPDGVPGTSRLPVREVAGLVTILFLTTYVSAQLVGGAKALGPVFEVDGRWALVVTAAIVLVYTLLGGYRAVVVTDVLQALFMLAGMVVLPLVALGHVGGFDGLVSGLRDVDAALPETERGLAHWSRGALATAGGLAIGLGSFGNPHILVRHMSLRDPREARAAAVTGTVWNVVMAAGAFLMGLAGRVVYPDVESFRGADREHLFATLGADMSTQYLFAGFTGFLLASLFAAVMSTCDSQLLVIASSLVRDFRRGTAELGLRASRLAVAGALVAAVALNVGDLPLVHGFVLLSWAALGAAFGPPLILVLYDSRTTARGVLAGMVTGAAVTAVWVRVEVLDRWIYELVPAFAASLLVTWALRRR